jgi:16S rRNA (uracil1498-N3)-methyltransferase
MHRVFVDSPLPDVPARLVIVGDEAHHALRAKRVRAGERVGVINGRGQTGVAIVIDQPGVDGGAARRGVGRRDEPTLALELLSRHDEAPARPALRVMAATPKGVRADEMVDQLSQVGASSWCPLSCRRAVVMAGETRLDRLTRVALEAAKQCGRAWVLEVGEVRTLDGLCAARASNVDRLGASVQTALVVADASGEPYAPVEADAIELLIGPEGGFDDDELGRLRGAGATFASFGPHVMRIETAAVAAAAIVIDRQRRR